MRCRDFGLALLLCTLACISAQADVSPLIEPGYRPLNGADEEGLWGEMEDYERSLQRSALLVKDRDLKDYVEDVLCKVAGDYCQDLRLYVIRNPGFNASMAPNGVVQVWTGLLTRVASEDELAAVLGHELAHYTQLHSLDRMRRVNASMTAGSLFDLGIGILTGVELPAGQFAALAHSMAYSRSDEIEADTLGTHFMVSAGYDPSAAANLWEALVEEEESAEVKRKKPSIFFSTHPASEKRVNLLKDYVSSKFSATDLSPRVKDRLVLTLDYHYNLLMEDQIDTNRYGRTEAMLERHRAMGVSEPLINFYYGEMYRQRGESGDVARAIQAYQSAFSGEKSVPEAYHQLGYLYMKRGENVSARKNFQLFLDHVPESDDRAMIEYYMDKLK